MANNRIRHVKRVVAVACAAVAVTVAGCGSPDQPEAEPITPVELPSASSVPVDRADPASVAAAVVTIVTTTDLVTERGSAGQVDRAGNLLAEPLARQLRSDAALLGAVEPQWRTRKAWVDGRGVKVTEQEHPADTEQRWSRVFAVSRTVIARPGGEEIAAVSNAVYVRAVRGPQGWTVSGLILR